MFDEIAAYLQIEPWPLEPNVVFWSSLMLVTGGVLGELVFRLANLPRIVGYSAMGMVMALMGYGTGNGHLGGTLRVIVDLALGLLLFELGSRVHLRWLRANPALLITSLSEALLSFCVVYFALRWIGLDRNLSLLCASFAVAASAAVVGRVASELQAAGQVTERMIMLTAMNTLIGVLVHKLVIGWLHLEQAVDWALAVSQPLYTFGGSVLVAAILTRLVALIARRLDLRDENSALLLLGLIMLAMSGARMLNLSTLLVPLIAGVLLRNTSDRPWIWPRHFGTAGGVLVLMLFVIVGSSWSMQALALGGFAAAVFLAARTLAKGIVVVGLARWSGIELRQAMGLTMALTPISGTALVMLADMQLSHPEFATHIAPIVLSSIGIMELMGPIIVQWGLRLAREVHPRTVPAPGGSK
jgi:Kef-type K+ transport system membrane component KefB